VAGGALALVVCGVSLYLALKHWTERPRPAIVLWAIAGVVVFYVLVGLAASAAGVEYGLVGIAAGMIPLSAVGLCWRRCVRALRNRTVGCETTRATRTRTQLPASAWTIRLRLATPPTTPTASTSPTSLRAGAGNTQLPTSPVPKRAASAEKDRVF
jgi:hypothetical protein